MHICGYVPCWSSPSTLIRDLFVACWPTTFWGFAYLSPISHLRNTGFADILLCPALHESCGLKLWSSGLLSKHLYIWSHFPSPWHAFSKRVGHIHWQQEEVPILLYPLHTAHYLRQTFNCADTSCSVCLPCRPQVFVVWNYTPISADFVEELCLPLWSDLLFFKCLG